MKRILLLVVVTIMATVSAQAQFPDDVKEVLKKCDQKMETYGTSEGGGVRHEREDEGVDPYVEWHIEVLRQEQEVLPSHGPEPHG